jgi:hypothetical protein
VEIAIAKLKKYKSPGSDQIPAELIQAGGEILLSEIHKLINSVWNKEIIITTMIIITIIIIVNIFTIVSHTNISIREELTQMFIYP